MSDDRQVEAILARALGPRPSVWTRFVRLARALGWSGAFGGAGPRLAGAVVVAAVVAVLGVAVAPGSAVGTFAIAPALLLLLTSLVDAADRVGPLAGLRRSTLFTVTEVTAIRIVVFTVCGCAFAAVVGAVSAAVAPELRPAPGSGLVVEGAAAAAMAAALVVVLLQHGHDRIVLVLPAVWVIAVVVPVVVVGQQWEAALRALPAPAWVGVVVVGLVLFGVMDGRALRPERGVLRAAGV